jgi:hypothetical protein
MNPAAIQQAIYNALNVTALTGLLTASYGVSAIFTDIPQVNDAGDPAYFPLVFLSFPSSTPFDTKSNLGGSYIVQVDVWSRSNSEAQVKSIAAKVYDLLHRQPLTIAGVTHITTDIERMDFVREPDGETRRCLMQYRVLTLA